MKEKMSLVVQKVKERKAVIMTMFMCAFVMTALSTSICHAEGSGGNIDSSMSTALSTAFTAVKTDVLSIITTALPPALAIMGIIIAIMVGVRFFKRAAK